MAFATAVGPSAYWHNGANPNPSHLSMLSPTVAPDGRVFLHWWNDRPYAGVDTGTAIEETWAAVGPRMPRDETDLQVVSISRTPRYPRYAPLYTYYELTEPWGFGPYAFTAATGLGNGQTAQTPRWPASGDPVTYTATVRNRGTNPWIGTLAPAWSVDGVTVALPSRPVNLEPGATATFAKVLAWDGRSHELRFSTEAADARPENNSLAADTRSVPFLSYVDETYLEEFREVDSPRYPKAATDDFIDWLNRHMARFNRMFADAGSAKRVHFDVLEVLPDGAPDPGIDRQPFAIFPFRYRTGDGSLRQSGNPEHPGSA